MAWLWLLLVGAALGLISLPYQALSSLGLALQQHLWLNSESVSAVAVALVPRGLFNRQKSHFKKIIK